MRSVFRIGPWVAWVAIAAWIAPAPPVWAHGAAVGIHLHLAPDPAARGETVTVSIRAVEKMSLVEIAFAGREDEKKSVRLEEPARELEVKLVLPEDVDTEVINIFVRAEVAGGKELLTSAILRVANPKPREKQPEG